MIRFYLLSNNEMCYNTKTNNFSPTRALFVSVTQTILGVLVDWGAFARSIVSIRDMI